ncbi:hypothetical protein INR49_024523, partial [Caranx melampygus]
LQSKSQCREHRSKWVSVRVRVRKRETQHVQLFEEMVEREDGVPLYSQYMEVNSNSQSARDRYLRLTNGIFLNEVMRVIDPNPKVERLYDSGRDDHMLRVQNFSILNRHLRAFYQVTQDPCMVLPLQWEELMEVEGADMQLVFTSMAKQIQILLAHRDTHLENRSLQGEVRGMRALRDELDCARERAARAEQLQTELQSCKHRLRSLEQTRTQLKEQQQVCAALQETKALLEEQLAGARARCSSLRELERDNHLLRQKIMDVEAERDTERQRVDELLEINMSLEAELSTSAAAAVAAAAKPLSVEVGEASTLRLLGAEQENAELRRRLEELQAQQEADSPDAKDELACLEMEHQKTLGEFQNLKNENSTLKQHIEQLVTKLQHLEDKMKEEGMKKSGREEEEKKGERSAGIQIFPRRGRRKGEDDGRDGERKRTHWDPEGSRSW